MCGRNSIASGKDPSFPPFPLLPYQLFNEKRVLQIINMETDTDSCLIYPRLHEDLNLNPVLFLTKLTALILT